MPSTDRKLELKAKTSVAQTGSQPFVYAKGLKTHTHTQRDKLMSLLFNLTKNNVAKIFCKSIIPYFKVLRQ
jgi:hypothetical protein